MRRETPWEEPAQGMTLKLRDDLAAIYTCIREKYQSAIDGAFDRVSRQIGYIVTISIPVTLEVGPRGKVKNISLDPENLKGTLFEQELTKVTKNIMADTIPSCEPGTFKLFLFWFEALKLKLRTDWLEPVHFLRRKFFINERPDLSRVVRKPMPEPAHWFDPGFALVAEEAVLISVIDDVYPELKLTERIATNRAAIRQEIKPEVMEPVHPPQIDLPITQSELQELQRLLRKLGNWK